MSYNVNLVIVVPTKNVEFECNVKSHNLVNHSWDILSYKSLIDRDGSTFESACEKLHEGNPNTLPIEILCLNDLDIGNNTLLVPRIGMCD